MYAFPFFSFNLLFLSVLASAGAIFRSRCGFSRSCRASRRLLLARFIARICCLFGCFFRRSSFSKSVSQVIVIVFLVAFLIVLSSQLVYAFEPIDKIAEAYIREMNSYYKMYMSLVKWKMELFLVVSLVMGVLKYFSD